MEVPNCCHAPSYYFPAPFIWHFFIYTMNLEKLIKIFKFEVRYNTECIGMFVLNGTVYGYF